MSGNTHRSVLGSFVPRKIIFPLYLTYHAVSVNITLHPTLHKIQMPMSEATLRAGTMCPSSTCGNPGISTSHMCVERTVFPSAFFMVSGFVALRTFCMGVSAITNTVVAPVSAIPCELGIIGLVLCTLCAHTSLRVDTFEVTIVMSSSSEVLIWVGYKTGSSINEFKHLNPNCSAPHRHMVGSWDLCIAFVHASYPAAIYCPEFARVYPS